MLIGFFFFVWFLAALGQEVRRLSGDGLLAKTVVIGGAAYGTLGVAGSALSTAIKTMSDDTYHHQVYSGLIHAAGDASYVILAGSGIAMASMIFAVALAIFAFGLLPRWVGWFGVVAGVAAIFSLFFFTMLVWLLWIAVASVLLYMRSSSPARARDALATA